MHEERLLDLTGAQIVAVTLDTEGRSSLRAITLLTTSE